MDSTTVRWSPAVATPPSLISSFYHLPRLLRTGLVQSFQIRGLQASTIPTSFRRGVMRLACTRKVPADFSKRDPTQLAKLLAYAKKLTCLTLRMWGIRRTSDLTARANGVSHRTCTRARTTVISKLSRLLNKAAGITAATSLPFPIKPYPGAIPYTTRRLLVMVAVSAVPRHFYSLVRSLVKIPVCKQPSIADILRNDKD
jgi:hypothetical protein